MKRRLFKVVALSLFALSSFLPVQSAVVSATAEPVATATGPDEKAVNAALEEFNSLSRRERKMRMREAKKLLKETKAAQKSGQRADDDTVLLAILAILLPPLAVYLKENAITTKFWISLILTLLFWIPGVVYALLVVFDVV
jgi:uncharacterized membrane protein YqaE (UPF0057 family)